MPFLLRVNVSSSQRSILSNIGFSKWEIDAYLILVKYGGKTALELANINSHYEIGDILQEALNKIPKKLNINEFKVRVSDFNLSYFSLSGLTENNLLMDMERQIVVVKSFNTASQAKDYYDIINQDAKVFKEISPEEYQVFPISADNYAVFYKQKNIPEYQKFFTENYKKKSEK